MHIETIQGKVLKAFKEVADCEVTLQSHISDDLGVDSLDLLSISSKIEETCRLRSGFTNQECESWKTIGDVVESVKQRFNIYDQVGNVREIVHPSNVFDN